MSPLVRSFHCVCVYVYLSRPLLFSRRVSRLLLNKKQIYFQFIHYDNNNNKKDIQLDYNQRQIINFVFVVVSLEVHPLQE